LFRLQFLSASPKIQTSVAFQANLACRSPKFCPAVKSTAYTLSSTHPSAMTVAQAPLFPALVRSTDSLLSPTPGPAPGESGTQRVEPSKLEAFAVSPHYLTHLDLPSSADLTPSRNVYFIPPSCTRPSLWPGLRYSTYATLQALLASLVVPFVIASLADRLRHHHA